MTEGMRKNGADRLNDNCSLILFFKGARRRRWKNTPRQIYLQGLEMQIVLLMVTIFHNLQRFPSLVPEKAIFEHLS